MKQHSYETRLKETVAPQPDPEARLRAKRAALVAFKHANAATPARPGFVQTLLGVLRPARTHGGDALGWPTRSLFAGAAGVCVAVIGLALIWPMIRDGGARLLVEPAALTPELERGETAAPPYANSAAAPSESRAAAASAGSAQAVVQPDTANNRTANRVQIPPAAAARPAAATQVGEVEVTAARPNLVGAQVSPAGPGLLKASAAEQGAAAQQTSPPLALRDSAVAEKKETQSADAIGTEDAGEFPETSVTDSLKRAPRVSITRQPPAIQTAPSEAGRDEMEEFRVTGARRKSAAPPKSAPAPVGTGNGPVAKGSGFAQTVSPEPNAAGLPPEGRDKFEHFDSNAVKQVADDPVSTFSADVDTSSYSFVRRQLRAGVLPQKDAVRAEELINYFDYSWPAPQSREQPFKPTVVVSDSPWGKGRKLVHIGIKGYQLDARQRPDANLVLLLDVSGSMDSPDKLPLVKSSMRLLVNGLKSTDTVAIVVYAGAAGLVLPPTPAGEKEKILAALDSLSPGGSTAGAAGIELAYQLAERSFRKEGVNRILLCTDGDFNVGIDDTNELKGFVERQREKGVFLSVLGFGQGNYRDELAQALAQNGNGVAAYIDTLSEAQKVLVQEAGASLFTIAKDVKLQVEFNPATVAEYRLIGYETRALKREDFNNDKVDAGDVGSGHSVTAIYEITPVGVAARMVEPSRYSQTKAPAVASGTANEYGFLRIRYKLPNGSSSQLIEQPINIAGPDKTLRSIDEDVQFSTAVAGFAQLLRGGQYTGAFTYDEVIKQALAARGDDPFGYRNEFVQLVRAAQTARGL